MPFLSAEEEVMPGPVFPEEEKVVWRGMTQRQIDEWRLKVNDYLYYQQTAAYVHVIVKKLGLDRYPYGMKGARVCNATE